MNTSLNREDAKGAKKGIFEPPRRQDAKVIKTAKAPRRQDKLMFLTGANHRSNDFGKALGNQAIRKPINRFSWRLGALAVQKILASWRFKKILGVSSL